MLRSAKRKDIPNWKTNNGFNHFFVNWFSEMNLIFRLHRCLPCCFWSASVCCSFIFLVTSCDCVQAELIWCFIETPLQPPPSKMNSYWHELLPLSPRWVGGIRPAGETFEFFSSFFVLFSFHSHWFQRCCSLACQDLKIPPDPTGQCCNQENMQ